MQFLLDFDMMQRMSNANQAHDLYLWFHVADFEHTMMQLERSTVLITFMGPLSQLTLKRYSAEVNEQWSWLRKKA